MNIPRALGIFAFLFFIVFVVVQLDAFQPVPADPPHEDNLKPKQERDYWVRAIQAQGAKQAYRLFVSTNEARNPGVQHGASHIIGEALYVAEGVRGVGVCDSSFSFGCFHGLFSFAISEHGTELVPLLDGECQKLKSDQGACQHGIGHGILQYFGYDRLDDALIACAMTERLDPISGCPSGVFMEYNVPLSEDAEGNSVVSPRPFDETYPYASCTSVSSEFALSCYHELAQWWAEVFDYDHGRVGALCASIEDADLSRACFIKEGDIIVSTNHQDLSFTRDNCALMPTEKGKEYCLFGAAQTLSWTPQTLDKTRALCAIVEEQYGVTCSF